MAKKGLYCYAWPRPMVTVDAAVFRFHRGRPQMLLVKRARQPFEGQWATPGGFVEMDEELEDAVARELREETGLSGIQLEQMRTFGTVGRDPRGRQITIVFMGILEHCRPRLNAGDDAAEARWFDIDRLPQNMAFDHREVAAFAIKKLKRKSIYRAAVKKTRSQGRPKRPGSRTTSTARAREPAGSAGLRRRP